MRMSMLRREGIVLTEHFRVAAGLFIAQESSAFIGLGGPLVGKFLHAHSQQGALWCALDVRATFHYQWDRGAKETTGVCFILSLLLPGAYTRAPGRRRD